MRLLKFFLWITLLACVAWGAAIFLGPTAISRAVSAYFGDAVKVQRLSVSPALEVSAAAVKFDFLGQGGAPAFRGISRGFLGRIEAPVYQFLHQRVVPG